VAVSFETEKSVVHAQPNTTLQPTSGAQRFLLFESWVSRRSRLSV
jgi:hypothetical protein